MAAFSVLGLHDFNQVPIAPKYHRSKAIHNSDFLNLTMFIRSYLLETFNNKYRKLRYALRFQKATLVAVFKNSLK